jgi:hydrophobic/amphiphilic exporter-1 (mainly G- bacteria), HAE1 family
MQSSSADDGTYTLAATFAIGTNPDLAQVMVQNRVVIASSSRGLSRCPRVVYM